MFVRLFVGAVALFGVGAGVMGGPRAFAAPAAEGSATADRCSLSKYHVTSVKPYRFELQAGYGVYTEFRGAELYVAAEPGLTREWLQRTVESDIASGACDFGATNAKVDVLSPGGGFIVQIRGSDERAAAEILRHAQLLSAPRAPE